MRSHNSEHSDTLPVIDVSALKHVAYVLDALIYYMRSGSDADAEMIRDGVSVHSWQDHEDNLNDETDDDPVNQSVAMEIDSMDGESDVGGRGGKKHSFFQRSDSMTFLGCPPPDPFAAPLVETLPLADQPHLLKPNSRKEELFGMPRPTVQSHSTAAHVTVTGDITTGQPAPFDRLPTHLALSLRTVPATGGPVVGALPAAEVPPCAGQAATEETEEKEEKTGEGEEKSAAVTESVAATPAETAVETAAETARETPAAASSQAEAGGITSVIVRPPSQTTNVPSMTLTEARSSPLTIPSIPLPMEPQPSTSSDLAIDLPKPAPSDDKPAVAQPSVIVHAGPSQPVTVPPVTDSNTPSTVEAKEPNAEIKEPETQSKTEPQSMETGECSKKSDSNPNPDEDTAEDKDEDKMDVTTAQNETSSDLPRYSTPAPSDDM